MAVETVEEIKLQKLIEDFLKHGKGATNQSYEAIILYLQSSRPDLTTNNILELSQLLRAFKTENVTDHTATACAITGYILGMKIVSTGGDLSNTAYSTLTNVGLLFSFGCALSFVSSSFDLLQNARRSHMQMKIILQNQKLTELMLRSWLVKNKGSNDRLSILKILRVLAQNQIATLKATCETNELYKALPFLRKSVDEKEMVEEEINTLENEILHNAEANLKTINDFITQKESPPSRFYFMFHQSEESKINTEVDQYINGLEDMLHRPLYDVTLNDEYSFHHRITTLSSTSLYGLHAQTLRELAIYFPFMTDMTEKKPDNDQALASLMSYSLGLNVDNNSNIFSGIYPQYLAIQDKIENKYGRYNETVDENKGDKNKVSDNESEDETEETKSTVENKEETEKEKRIAQLRIHCFHLLDDLKTINQQIKIVAEKKKGAEAIKQSLEKKEEKKQADPPSPPVTDKDPHVIETMPEKNVLFHVKAPDTQTTYHWRKFWKEIKGFFATIYAGLSLGKKQLLTPDHKKYQYLTMQQGVFFLHPRLWGYHCKCGLDAIKEKYPRLHTVLSSIYVFFNIPYFIWYALKRFGNLLTHLEKVVTAVHKSVRDVDHALAHRSGDNLLITLIIRWPLKISWAVITFIPQTLLGFVYWALSVIGLALKTENNIAKTSRAINPDWLADFVETHYLKARQHKDKAFILERTKDTKNLTEAADQRFTYNITLFFLYAVVLLGGILNTIWTPIKKCWPLGNDRQVQHSRDQLFVTGKIMYGKMKAGLYSLYGDPIISAWKQHQEQHHKINAEYPDSWFIAPMKHLALYCQFVFIFVLNTFFLATFRFIVSIMKTAPLITASAIATSTIFGGISIPFLGTLPFAGSTAVGATALGCDLNNGGHDGYNLAASILKKDHMDRVEKAALKHVYNNDSKSFNAWKAIYEQVETGKIFMHDLQHKIKDKAKGSYSNFHAQKCQDNLEVKYKNDYQPLARTILSAHLAYFLVNTSKSGKSQDWMLQQYKFLFHYFCNESNNINHITAKMVNNLKALSPEDKKNYIAGFAVQFAYDYTFKLTQQIHRHYADKDNAFELYLLDEQELTVKGKRSSKDLNSFTFQQNGKDDLTARKLSLWERFKYFFVKPSFSIVDGYELTHSGTGKNDYHLMVKNTAYEVSLTAGLNEMVGPKTNNTSSTAAVYQPSNPRLDIDFEIEQRQAFHQSVPSHVADLFKSS